MISALLLKIIYYIIWLLSSLFLLANDVSINGAFSSSIATAMSYAQAINKIFPVSELLYTIVGVFLAYEIAYFGWKIINWVIRKIPTIS